MCCVKVLMESGNFFFSEINLSFDEAKDYYLRGVKDYITECEFTGKETFDRIVNVEEVL